MHGLAFPLLILSLILIRIPFVIWVMMVPSDGADACLKMICMWGLMSYNRLVTDPFRNHLLIAALWSRSVRDDGSEGNLNKPCPP